MVDDIRQNENKELIKQLTYFEHKYGPYIEQRGLKNWRNLFKKPTLLEGTILFMLIMALFIAWAYQRDTALCREMIDNVQQNACLLCNINATNTTNLGEFVSPKPILPILKEEIYNKSKG